MTTAAEVAKVRAEMVIHIVRIDVPPARAEEFARWQASHVVEAVAAMGRSAIAARARVNGVDDPTQFRWIFELSSLSSLESYMISRERDDLEEAFKEAFPEAKVYLEFGEQEGSYRRGLRYGEDAGAAFVVEVMVPTAELAAWKEWYDGEHVPAVLAAGSFTRARRFEIHGDDEGRSHQLIIYDAIDLPSVESYVKEKGSRLAEEHASKFSGIEVQRTTWEWLG